MSPTKLFLILFAVCYVVVAIGLNVTLGPPGLRAEYVEEYKADHDRYLEIIKSDEYKLWGERPKLNPLDDAGRARADFVEEYEARDAFVAEQRRRGLYQTLFDIFNFAMILALVIRFARAPLLSLIDSMILTVRERIENAANARSAAAQRKALAQGKLDGLEAERLQIAEQTQARSARQRKDSEESRDLALKHLEKETADRKHHEEILAQQTVKKELVDEAIRQIAERYGADQAPELASVLVDQFVEELEGKS